MHLAILALAVAIFPASFDARQEANAPKDRIPTDSIELVVTGCLKGRILTTTRTPRIVDGDELEAAVDRFQISGKKALLDQVKEHDRKEVEIRGFIRKSDLKEPGIRVPGGRLIVSPGRGRERYGPPASPTQRVVIVQASAVRRLEGSCVAMR